MTSLILQVTRAVIAAVVVTTFLPAVRHGSWIIRIWDFPRVQLAVIAALLIIGVSVVRARLGWRTEHLVWLALLTSCVAWQTKQILPYTPAWSVEVDPALAGDGDPLRLLALNLDVRNDRHLEMTQVVRDLDPDVMLLTEVDAAWSDSMAEVRASFPHVVEEIRGEGLGLTLWSRLPLEDGRVRFLVSDRRPSIFATIRLPDGRAIRFAGLHPTPPGHEIPDENGRHDSRIRDAELLLVAREVAADPEASWIVAGDFNDVAWSRTTRLFAAVSGLLDPRIGRGMFNTYHAHYFLLRYPIDHVFVSRGFRLAAMERHRAPGSDHFAVTVDLTLPRSAGTDPAADEEMMRRADDLIDEGQSDASENGNAPPRISPRE